MVMIKMIKIRIRRMVIPKCVTNTNSNTQVDVNMQYKYENVV